jgi:hypothetical protein
LPEESRVNCDIDRPVAGAFEQIAFFFFAISSLLDTNGEIPPAGRLERYIRTDG